VSRWKFVRLFRKKRERWWCGRGIGLENLSHGRKGICLQNNSKGLQDIHFLNIVHLDIKPGNILIDGSGRLKIGDFGHAAKCPVVYLYY
jgi:serine/threonine protein kinase